MRFVVRFVVMLVLSLWLAASASAQDAPREEVPAEPVPTASRAKPAALSYIRLEGANECAEISALASDVTSRLGHNAWVSVADAELFIETVVARTEEGYRIAIFTFEPRTGDRGEREILLAGDSCAGLLETAGLAISLMIDPDVLTRSREEPPAPAAPAPPPSPVVAEAPPLPEPAVPVGALAGTAVLTAGYRDVPTVGASLRGSWFAVGRLSIELSAWFVSHGVARIDASRGAVLSTWGVTPAACVRAFDTGDVDLRGCAGLGVGALHSAGVGFRETNSAIGPLAQAEISARLRIRIGGDQGIELAAGAVVPLVRDNVWARGSSGERVDIFETSPIFAMFELGFFSFVRP